jgi:alkylation response protein AidB-like acyl-CoA dehydrogenase
MNLNFSEEQLMLKEQIQKFCESDYDFYKREDVVKSEKDFDENVWNLFAEQGWLSMPFSEESVVLALVQLNYPFYLRSLEKRLL